jgi:hypothetical protein
MLYNYSIVIRSICLLCSNNLYPILLLKRLFYSNTLMCELHFGIAIKKRAKHISANRKLLGLHVDPPKGMVVYARVKLLLFG